MSNFNPDFDHSDSEDNRSSLSEPDTPTASNVPYFGGPETSHEMKMKKIEMKQKKREKKEFLKRVEASRKQILQNTHGHGKNSSSNSDAFYTRGKGSVTLNFKKKRKVDLDVDYIGL